MTRRRPFQQLDVFTDTPGLGNGLAVVLEAEGLDEPMMQRFARWTGLSETTFVLPPTDPAADYRVRIYTPGGELPFAGHPTLGTAHAWRRAGGVARNGGRIVQQCGIGLVDVRAGSRLAFAAPPLRRSDPDPAQLAHVLQALGLRPEQVLAAQRLDNGPSWLGLWLDDASTVLALRPDHAALRAIGHKVGVAAAWSRSAHDAPPVDVEVRAFAAPIGVDEDPVTGSLNASLAQWLQAEGLRPHHDVAGQGRCLGRDGRVHLERDDAGVLWVGGDVADCVDGHVLL